MSITSRLALSQLIRNRKRTVGTIFAISLSTALITAVMCFSSSGIDMLKNALGDGFGEYGGAYNAIVFFPAIILTLIIVFMSIAVISNIFQASADNRVKELGILKCVGGTSKQIKKTVISEGFWLSIIGIPFGLFLGVILGYICVYIAGNYIDRIVEITRSIVMRKFDLKLVFSVKFYYFIFSSVFSFITVLLSAFKPAKQMSKMTAVECVSFGNSFNKKINRLKGNKLWKFLWGFEGELAVRSINRNRKSFKRAVRALSTGICLLIVTSALTSQLFQMKSFMKSDHNFLLVDYSSLRDEGVNSITGRRENKILNPINSDTYNEITDKLSAFGDFDVWGIGSNRDSYFVKADLAMFTDNMSKLDDVVNEFGEMDFDMVSLSDDLYRTICDATGTEYGGNVLINTYTYNVSGERREITPFSENLDQFTLVTPDGQSSSLKIDGFLDRDDLDEWLFDFINRATVMVIVPGASARNFDWYCDPTVDEDEFISYAKSVMDSYYPILSDDSYVDQGYSVRISRQDTMVSALNVMIILGEVIMYGFVCLLILIGFTGFISTVISNIRARSKEFAILKSVGMTNNSLKKMLYSESMYCTFHATIKGGLFGIVIPWLINLSFRNVFPIKFHFPLFSLIFSVLVVVLVVFVITYVELRKMKEHSLIETIRMDSIR